MTATERAQLPVEELAAIQGEELNAVTTAYMVLGLIMLVLLLAIRLTKMPNLRESGEIFLTSAKTRLPHPYIKS